MATLPHVRDLVAGWRFALGRLRAGWRFMLVAAVGVLVAATLMPFPSVLPLSLRFLKSR